MKQAFLILALASTALAQSRGQYQVERKSTGVTSEAITIHVPTGSARSVVPVGASVYCSVGAEVTIERDGTAPTSTAVTPVKINSTQAASAVGAYRSSNVGTANRVTSRARCVAGATILIPLTDHTLTAGENITARVALDSSGDTIVNVQYTEN